MIGPSFMDDIDCGDFFDNIDDLLDFPIEDVEGAVIGGDCDGFQSVWPPLPDTFMGSSSGFSGNSTTGNSELPTELPVPYEDIAQLEWLSTFVEDSFSAGSIILDKENSSDNNNTFPKFQTSSPVSVLDSSSSCSGGKTIPGRARSKRSRPPTFNPRPVMSLISPTSSVTEATSMITTPELPNDLESFAESHPPKNIPKPISEEHKKKKKMKLSLPFESQVPITVRKCLHCEITKTPQWRAGPMGPKTLCNACGVRYKSGRLFPEYRPAASPTFTPAVHSNSHKKVLEMRNKVDQKTSTVMTAIATSTMPTQEFLPKSSHLLDSI